MFSVPTFVKPDQLDPWIKGEILPIPWVMKLCDMGQGQALPHPHITNIVTVGSIEN